MACPPRPREAGEFYGATFGETSRVIDTRLVAETEDPEAKGKAMAVLSLMVGAVTLSRAVDDPGLAQSFLDAAAEQIREVVASPECRR